MIRKKLVLHLSLLLIGIVVFELSVSSCASKSSPTGGPRDTIAPSLDTSFPANFSTSFTSTNIELIFDEYLSLKSPNQQIIVSPPLKKAPLIILKGRSIFIEIEDTLKTNTTYTISFGSSITDFTEGNANKNFKYIFSTGTYIDSLSLHGHLSSNETGEALAEKYIALYEIADSTISQDSLAFKELPTYYTFTDVSGHFEMEYLKSGRFLLLSFDDPQSDFKLNGNENLMAYYPEPVNSFGTSKELELHAYVPEKKFKYFGARHKRFGEIQFGFSKAPEGLKITLNADSIPLNLVENSDRDSLKYWFVPEESVDSLIFYVSAKDMTLDTTVVFLKNFDKSKITVNPISKTLKASDSIGFESLFPLDRIDTNSIFIFTNQDTIRAKTLETNGKVKFWIHEFPKKPKAFRVYIKKMGLTSAIGIANDSLTFDFKNLKKEDLGNLDFKIVGDTNLPVVSILKDNQGRVISQISFTDSIQLNLRGLLPGKYSSQVIVDTDLDKKWTTGEFFSGKQPEKIILYKDLIEIRANWDLELEWQFEIN